MSWHNAHADDFISTCNRSPLNSRRSKQSKPTDGIPVRLDDELCFAFFAAARALTRIYREVLDPIGLTYPQLLVLIVLWEENGATVSRIGDRLMLDSGTLTPLIKRMETMDLVRRERGTDDEREVHVWLQPKGNALQSEAIAARKLAAARLGMSESEIRMLRGEIMAVIENL